MIMPLGLKPPSSIKEMTVELIGGTIFGELKPKKVIFNYPATIILWSDDTKTVVKCGKNDEYDYEKGIALCYMKKMMGNTSRYNEVFRKWVPEEEPMTLKEFGDGIRRTLEYANHILNKGEF